MELATILRALEVAGLSGIRPSWVLVATAVAGALGYVVFPSGLGFLATWPGAGALLVFAVLEHLAERDTDMLQIFGAVQLGLSAATAIVATGAVSRLDGHAPPWALQVGAVVLALATIGVRRTLKTRLLELAANVSTPAKWLARIEEGGFVLGAVLVLASPLILLVVVLVLAVLGAFGLGALKALDATRRRPCPGCGYSARKEAQRCAGCHAALRPETVLRLPPRLGQRLSALLGREGAEDGAPTRALR
jgi:hypothetical protein